ncbi:MAG: Calx-beta domain-containing protein [Chthoniobacterales bacterium]
MVTLTLKRTGDLSEDSILHLATSDGTALAGSDYIAKSVNKIIPAGAATATFKVKIIDDHAPEPTERFTVTLTGSPSAELGPQNTATVTIIDKDGPPPTIQFESATYRVKEKDGPAVLTLKRRGKQSTTATVHFATSDGTALAGIDYTAKSGDVTFTAGGSDTQTIEIPITNNHMREPDKSFQATLSSPAGAKLGAPKITTVTIVDLD